MRAQCTRGCYTRWKEEWFTKRGAGCWCTVKGRRAKKAAPPPLKPWPPLFVVWLVDLGAYHDLPSKRARFLQLTRKNGRCWAYIFIFRGRIGSSRELLKRPKPLSLPPPYPFLLTSLYLFLSHRLSHPEPIKRPGNKAPFVRVPRVILDKY